jgi:hypothetical protein
MLKPKKSYTYAKAAASDKVGSAHNGVLGTLHYRKGKLLAFSGKN